MVHSYLLFGTVSPDEPTRGGVAVIDVAKSKQQEAAMHLAMRKLLPREVGLMAQVTMHAPEIVPLEQQIQEGLYLSEDIPVVAVQSWVHAFPNATKAKEVWTEIVRYG